VPRIIEIMHNGKTSNFTLTKINRSRLYGSKRRIAVDAHGQECSRAALTRDGRHILPNGGSAMLYLDEQGDVVERNQLRAIDPEGDVIKPGESTPDAALEVVQAGEAAEVLECGITHVYALEPVFICAELEASLSQGAIYRLPFPTPTGSNNRQSFLLGNNTGYFLLLCCERTGFEFIGLAEADLSPPDIGEDGYDAGDDIDFGMM